MEAIRKQASKLREQVAKQQEAVFKQISRRFSHEPYLVDEDEIQCHQKLQMLYASTKAAKHLQRDIVRGLEAYIGISSKQMEVVKRLSEDCCKYGTEYQNYEFPLASAAVDFGTCHILMEKERDGLLRILGDQVYEPIRAMIMSAPLEDARLLTYRYERIRQDVEAQIAEVVRRQLKSKETGATTDVSNKLQNAESKLTELRTTLSALGREATAAMMAVESQQQVITFERLLSMVEAERAYHQNVATILDKLHDEMVQTRENHESSRQAAKPEALQFQTGREELKTTQSDSESVPEAEMETSHSQTRKEDLTTSQSHEEPVAQAARTVTVQSQTAEENFKTDQPHHESESLDAMTETVQYEIGKEGSMTIQSQQDQVIQDRITLAMQFPTGEKGSKTSLSGDLVVNGQHPTYFVGQVIHPFDAQADGELSFSVGDYVVVRQVAPNGWSEGECKGKAGWFPSAYVEHRDKAPASKVIEPNLVT